jgi:Protein of unknown function (DUF1348)
MTSEALRPPLPPFDAQSAAQKVRLAEDACNTREPQCVALAYTRDSVWRNRAEFLTGREAIEQFLIRKWSRGARPPPHQGALGVPRQPHRRSFCVRMARRFGELVPLVRQRELGVRRAGLHAPAHREHQRPADQRARTEVPLAAWAPAGRPSRSFGAGPVRAKSGSSRDPANGRVALTERADGPST